MDQKTPGIRDFRKDRRFWQSGNSFNFLWVGSSLALEHTNLMTTTLLNGQPVEAVQPDLQEVDEWLEAFDQVVDAEGPSGAARLLDALTRRAPLAGVDVPVQLNTPYVHTIPVSEELSYSGDRTMERRLKSLIRGNALAMVHRQNKKDPCIRGGSFSYSQPSSVARDSVLYLFF